MIVQFWLGAILLFIIAAALLLSPFLTSKKGTTKSNNENRNELNRALYDVRIAELDQDEAQGLLRDKDKIIKELQYNLLDDINDQVIVTNSVENRWIWLPGLLTLIFATIALYWSVGAYQQVASWEKVMQRYPALQEQLFSNQSSQPSEQDLRDIMLGLRTHLATDTKDAKGWLLYSRLGMVFKDTDLALDSIKKAYQLDPESIDIRLVYAQLKMQKGDEYSQQQAERILADLLEDHPNELQAWSMYAFMALELQNYPAAIARWQKMLTLVKPDSEQAGMLRDSIGYAQNKLSETTQPVKADEPIAEQNVDQNIELTTPIYRVNVSVADNVVVPDSGFIIVYAQAVSGPKMPLAAVKLALTELPISTQISDANVMMQGMKLSDQSEFIIKVRLSKEGDVMKKSGDWQGVSQIIKAGNVEPINIVISELL